MRLVSRLEIFLRSLFQVHGIPQATTDLRLGATNKSGTTSFRVNDLLGYSSGRVIRTHGAEAQPQVLRWFFVGWAASLRFLSGGFLPKVKIHD